MHAVCVPPSAPCHPPPPGPLVVRQRYANALCQSWLSIIVLPLTTPLPAPLMSPPLRQQDSVQMHCINIKTGVFIIVLLVPLPPSPPSPLLL